jgi:hypothetical protein
MSLFLSCRSLDLLEGLDYALLLGQIQSEGKRSTDRKNKDMTPIIATDIDRCPVQNLGTARLPNLDRMRHTDFRNILMQNRFDKFIILTIILPLEHDSVIRREHAFRRPPCLMIYAPS